MHLILQPSPARCSAHLCSDGKRLRLRCVKGGERSVKAKTGTNRARIPHDRPRLAPPLVRQTRPPSPHAPLVYKLHARASPQPPCTHVSRTSPPRTSRRRHGWEEREGGRGHESTRARARRPMEMKPSASDKKVKRPPSRLQKHAPRRCGWSRRPRVAHRRVGRRRMPIPLLSPLVVSPSAAWEPDDQAAAAAGAPGGGRRAGRSWARR